VVGGAVLLLHGFTVSRSKRVLLLHFVRSGEIGTTLRVRDIYFSICTVYATTRDLAGELNTGSLKCANIIMFFHS